MKKTHLFRVIQMNCFYIPLSKKAFVNNERFSLAGFPSLYLSSMLLLAWQECGYPKKYYYSEYQYEKLNGSRGNRVREVGFDGGELKEKLIPRIL